MTFSRIPATFGAIQTGWTGMGTIALDSRLTQPKTIDIAPSSFKKSQPYSDEGRAANENTTPQEEREPFAPTRKALKEIGGGKAPSPSGSGT
jgi:hypothetical protein